MLKSTVSLAQASSEVWDVAIIGSGPSGATAARELALRGSKVLLLDKAEFPRAKVCGCCLNAEALQALSDAGIDEITSYGKPLTDLKPCVAGSSCRIQLPSSMVLSREVLDQLLISKAIDTGVQFLCNVTALIGPVQNELRLLTASNQQDSFELQARLVLVADGLSGRALALCDEFTVVEAPDSRVGAGVILASAPEYYQSETIFMACGAGGYVGLVRLEDDRLDVAAAFDREFLRSNKHPGLAAQEILRQSGLPMISELAELPWRGTSALTRRRVNVAAERIFVIGDAAAYVEPFTGQGIAWAISSANAVVSFALEALSGWELALIERWNRKHRQLIVKRQSLSQFISAQLRKPKLLKTAVAALNFLPQVSKPLVDYLAAGKGPERGRSARFATRFTEVRQ